MWRKATARVLRPNGPRPFQTDGQRPEEPGPIMKPIPPVVRDVLRMLIDYLQAIQQ
jgi:hypothetical protein